MPYGTRRGAGKVLVRTSGHTGAARALDNFEEVVREHYSHIEAGELADQMNSALNEAGQLSKSNIDGGRTQPNTEFTRSLLSHHK